MITITTGRIVHWGLDYLGFEVDTSINSNRVCCVLERIVWFKGMPEMITVDNCHEFIGKSLDAWAHRHGVKLVFNRPGKPGGLTPAEFATQFEKNFQLQVLQ